MHIKLKSKCYKILINFFKVFFINPYNFVQNVTKLALYHLKKVNIKKIVNFIAG